MNDQQSQEDSEMSDKDNNGRRIPSRSKEKKNIKISGKGERRKL